MDAEFGISDTDYFGFVINGLPVSYNKNENMLSCGEKEAKLKPVDGKIRLRILIDRVSAEVFANDGRLYMPIRKSGLSTLDEKIINPGLSIFTKGGDTMIHSLTIHELKSIWNSDTSK